MDGSLVFTRWRHCPSPSNMCFLEPSRVHILSGTLIVSVDFAQLRAEGRYNLQWATPFPQTLPLHMGGSGPPCNTCFLGLTPVSVLCGIWIFSPVFAQLMTASLYTSKWAAPLPLIVAALHGDLGPHLIHGSLGPPESTTQTPRWSVQPFLQGSQSRQTDNVTPSVKIGSIYVCSTAYGRIWSWLRGPVVEHWSLAGVLSLSCLNL